MPRTATRETRSLRLRGTMKVMRTGRFVVLAVVALVATACSAGQYVPPTTETGLPPTTTSVPPIPAVVQFAVDWSANDGNSTPTTLVWGVCGSSTAQFCNPGGYVAGTHLDVLELSGGSGFLIGPGADAPPNARAPYVVVVIDSATWEVLEISYGGAENLSQSLSTPETDSLTGISPISPSAFHQRYRSHR